MATYSNWREDLIEVIDTPTTEKKAEKKVKESKVNNKVVINPTFKEAVDEMGGHILEVAEVEDKTNTEEDPQIKSKEKRQGMIKRQVLLKKLQAVRAGGGADITAGYEPEGEVIEGYAKPNKELPKGSKVHVKKGVKVQGKYVKEGIKGEDNETRKAAALERKSGVKTRLSPSAGKANVAKMLWDIRNAKSNPKNESKEPTEQEIKTENEKKRKNALQIQKIIGEADLSAADRRALPNKDFVFPGKGEGPEGKQRGAYPINDKKHALSLIHI